MSDKSTQPRLDVTKVSPDLFRTSADRAYRALRKASFCHVPDQIKFARFLYRQQ